MKGISHGQKHSFNTKPGILSSNSGYNYQYSIVPDKGLSEI